MQKRVLVVDDDEMNLTRARIILQKDYEVLLANSGLEDDVLSAIKLGAVNYLKKPFLPQELLRRVALEFENQ